MHIFSVPGLKCNNLCVGCLGTSCLNASPSFEDTETHLLVDALEDSNESDSDHSADSSDDSS